MRWPGGTFTKIYHWKDAIGPAADRPRRPNLIWGGIEDNQFGTDEFIRWCREIGTEPVLTVNMATGSPEEAAHWVEYCNGTNDTSWARLRARNGSAAPHRVQYWALGNEEDAEPDCGRHQDPHDYAKDAWQFIKLMKLTDPSIRIIVAGTMRDTNWNRVVLDELHPVADYFSVHSYAGSTPEYPGLFARIQAFERDIRSITDLVRSYPDRVTNFNKWYRFPPRQAPVQIALDEWGVWNGSAKREELWGLNQTYTWKDALGVASWLNALQRHADRLTMANWAQTVNIIAPILANRTHAVRQTIWFPMELFPRVSGTRSLAADLTSPPLVAGQDALPALDASATVSEDGKRITLIVVNRSPDRDLPARLTVPGATLTGIEELTAESVDASNSLGAPDRNCVRTRRPEPPADPARHTFPKASITALTFTAP